MTQIVEIKRLLPGGRCEVFVRRETACGGSCSTCGGCGDAGAAIASAKNSAGALPGDIAEVEAKSSAIVGSAAAVYLLPAVLAIVGGIVAEWLAQGFAAAGVAAGLAAGVVFVMLFGRRRKGEMLDVTRVVSRGNSDV